MNEKQLNNANDHFDSMNILEQIIDEMGSINMITFGTDNDKEYFIDNKRVMDKIIDVIIDEYKIHKKEFKEM
ncbi:MAG: hypothetical protein IMF01_09540 [Proteobacteria bacterium]|nr:hypothetical protein [Pseudomonadota bacterium]